MRDFLGKIPEMQETNDCVVESFRKKGTIGLTNRAVFRYHVGEKHRRKSVRCP